MRSLFSHKIFFKGTSFSSFLPLRLDRSELPLISNYHSEEVVKEEKTEEEIFNEKFARCIAVNCRKLGKKGCKSYPGYEEVHWANGKRCFAAPFEHKVVEGKKRQGQQKQYTSGPNVGYNFNRRRGKKKCVAQELAPATVVKAASN